MTAGARTSASRDAHNADATASTLNCALGRRHMKSWMTGAFDRVPFPPSGLAPYPAPPVSRKRGRPRKYPLPEAVDQQHATAAATYDGTPTTAPSAEKLPPSNSTSPQLANIVTDHSRSRGHGNVDFTILPSPTPSEEDPHGRGLQNQELGTRQLVNVEAFNFPSLRSPSASSPAPATTARSPTRQNYPPPKRPIGEDPVPVEKRARSDTAPQSLPASASTIVPPSDQSIFPDFPRRPSAPHTQHVSPSLGQAPSPSLSLGQVSNRQTASPQLVQTTQEPGRLPSPRSNLYPVQDRFVQHAPAHQTHVNPQLNAQLFGVLPGIHHFAQSAPVILSQRRASYHDDWYTYETCIRELRSFDAAYPATLRNRKDGIRLRVLEEAVRGHDFAYLTLHQYYCLMTFSPQALPLTLRRTGNLNVAYLLMREVLDDNSQLSPTVLAFFCNFPFTVDYLASTWPTRYQHAEHEFVGFVSYSANIRALRQASERRRVPPTPREFANCAITSLTFQRLLFRSIVRVLWGGYPRIPETGQYEDQALNAFNKAHSVFEQRRSIGILGDREQANLELRGWKYEYVQITKMFEASLQRQGYQPIDSTLPHLNQPPQPQPHTHSAPGPADMLVSRRQQPPPPTIYPRTASQAHPSPRSHQGPTPLLPRPGLIQPQQRVPVPSRFGLHQAHLRSPVLQVANLSSPTYYFWQGYVRKPQGLKNANTTIEKLSFTLSAKEIEILASALPAAPGATDSRLIDENHKMIRLRCIKWPADHAPRDEEWAVADNCWIPHSYFTLNDAPLQLRKKLHNGKDLPVDLTGLVRKGENVLEVSVMSNSDDKTHRNYLVAVEFLGIMTKASIKQRCQKKTIAAERVMSDIRRKLLPSPTEDDDIVLMESTLTINLRDPFSASKICDTPVRGTACLHNECFDLDTFLETRPRKGDVTAADQWRCPICKADARPNVLVVDGFLVEVRKELERKGLLDTRAIIVSQDGSWKPKHEERDPNGVSDRDTPEPTSAAAPTAARPKQPTVHEIIDLESD